MVCVVAHVRAPGASCQTVSLVPWMARASHPAVGPCASVTVPGGSEGSGRYGPAAVRVSARFPVKVIAVVPAVPKDAEVSLARPSGRAGERVQWVPLSAEVAVSRRAAGPLPAASSAVVAPAVVVVSRSTVTAWWA